MRRVRVFGLAVLLLGMVATVGRAATIEWGDWKVFSSENFQEGRKHKGYPLTYLFDYDPATAWVFSGVPGKSWDTLDKDMGGARYALLLVPKKRPVVLDSLRLMNGYNRSAAVFRRNDRVTEIRVTVVNAAGKKTVKTVRLPDRMGWHSVALPRQAVARILIEMVGFAPGQDRDVCLSGLALYDGARRIAMRMPRAVVYSDGEGEQYLPSDILVDRRGGRIAEAMEYETYWSPSGRFVMGRLADSKFWVADVQAEKPAVFFTTPRAWEEARWVGDGSIELWGPQGKREVLDVTALKKAGRQPQPKR